MSSIPVSTLASPSFLHPQINIINTYLYACVICIHIYTNHTVSSPVSQMEKNDKNRERSMIVLTIVIGKEGFFFLFYSCFVLLGAGAFFFRCVLEMNRDDAHEKENLIIELDEEKKKKPTGSRVFNEADNIHFTREQRWA